MSSHLIRIITLIIGLSPLSMTATCSSNEPDADADSDADADADADAVSDGDADADADGDADADSNADSDAPLDDVCMNDDDLAILRDADMEGEIGACEPTCSSDHDFWGCLRACLDEATGGLSTPCLDCFADLAVCIFDACEEECVDLFNDTCRPCVAVECGPSFEDCSGLTMD